MFKLKIINKPKMIKMKCNIEFPQIVLANMQEKEITPTKEIQIVEPDRNYDGLSKVIVNKIPDEYIIPDGNLEISQNGTFDVTDKVNAIVNVPEKKLGTKTITTNGIYKATDDSLDGYSEVEVTTSGVDINEYLNNTLYNATSSKIECGTWLNSIKKLPQDVHLDEDTTTCNSLFEGYPCKTLNLSNFNTSKVTSMAYMFSSCLSLTNLDLSNFDTSKVTDMRSMFDNCSKLTSLDLSNFDTSNVLYMQNMFSGCSSLTNLNLSNFDFTKVIIYNYMFRNVPTNCYILCKDATAKEWITSKFTSLTNVHYVGEEG